MAEVFEWSTKVSELEKLIEKIANPHTRQTMLDRFIQLVSRARKVPNNRAHSFGVIREMVIKVADSLVDVESQAREELGMAPLETFRVPPDDETEE